VAIEQQIAQVDCGTCTACCKKQVITLEPEDDPTAYKHEIIQGKNGELRVLAHKENGDCYYLGPTGCTIHGHQPAVCRAFDCVAFAQEWPRSRRRGVRMKAWDPVLKAGQQRLQARTRAIRLAHELPGEIDHVRNQGLGASAGDVIRQRGPASGSYPATGASSSTGLAGDGRRGGDTPAGGR